MEATGVTHPDYHFILNSFTANDIDAIIHDLEHYQAGFEYLYAVDTYDIMENYMPYYQIQLFSSEDRHSQAQKFICYDYFFGGINTTNCILLDEYKIELFAAKNKLNRDLRQSRAVLKNLEDLKKETGGFLERPERAAAFFKKNLEVILLLLILNDKRNSILEEFFYFIKRRLSITQIKLKKAYEQDAVEKVFIKSQPSAFSIRLFESYVDRNQIHLIRIENHDERHVYLSNTFRDIQAIERIININQQFETAGLKYKLIYLSSARKTYEIFHAMDRLIQKPADAGTQAQMNTHRNIYQYFLLDRFKHEFEKDPANGLAFLRDLRELLSKMDTNLQDPKSQTVLRLVKKMFDEKSNILDNHFYYSIYETYKMAFNPANSGKGELISQKDIVKVMKALDKNRHIYGSRAFSLEYSLSQLNQTYEVVETYWGPDDFEPEYRLGKDIIRNPYQSLPVLLLIGESFNSEVKEKLYRFLNLAIELDEAERQLLKESAREIMAALYNHPTNTLYAKFLKSIITTYLNLIAPGKSKTASSPENSASAEDKLIYDLEKQYSLIKHQFSQIDIAQSRHRQSVAYTPRHRELLVEIVYMLLWLYRRNLREDEGIGKVLDLVNPNDEDPRIFQGLGLSYVSKAYQLLKNGFEVSDEVRIAIDKAIHYLRLAEDHFKLLINTNSRTNTSSLVIKNFIAVLNSLADIHVLKYELLQKNPDFGLIETARAYIKEIKYLFNTIDLIYDEHPTYSGTEIDIEYFEALHFFEAGLISSAHQKIVSAALRQQMVSKHAKTPLLVDEIFRNKTSRISKLQMKIIDHYKK